MVNSNLTQPTNEFPIYALQGSELTFYPTTISNKGQVESTYFRYPKVPKWTYITLTNGEPVFDQSQNDYQDFELPPEDEYKLVTKILEYIQTCYGIQFDGAFIQSQTFSKLFLYLKNQGKL